MEILGLSKLELLQIDENLLSNLFYSSLGYQGLKQQAENQHKNAEDIPIIKKFLKPKDIILELGCGYGRILLEYLKEGFQIQGLDLNEDLLQSAKQLLEEHQLNTTLTKACMSATGLEKNYYDKLLCVWSSFSHILTEKKQLEVLNEMHRILKPGGSALIEVIDGGRKKPKSLLKEHGFGEKGRLLRMAGKDKLTVIYLHDRQSFIELCQKSKFQNFVVKYVNMNHVRHLVVILKKEQAK